MEQQKFLMGERNELKNGFWAQRGALFTEFFLACMARFFVRSATKNSQKYAENLPVNKIQAAIFALLRENNRYTYDEFAENSAK